jgi:hypothetical protein
VAWAATIVAIGFALLNWLSSVKGYSDPAHDPMVGLSPVTETGLIWYTYFTHQYLEHARASATETREQVAANEPTLFQPATVQLMASAPLFK